MLNQYQHIKKANPKFPILIRECNGAEARLVARYGNIRLRLQPSWPCVPYIGYCDCFADFGVEHAVPVNGLDSQSIESKLQELIKRGESLPRYLS